MFTISMEKHQEASSCTEHSSSANVELPHLELTNMNFGEISVAKGKYVDAADYLAYNLLV